MADPTLDIGEAGQGAEPEAAESAAIDGHIILP